MPAFILDQTPLDSPVFVLADEESTLAVPGRDFLLEVDALETATETLVTLYFGTVGYNHTTAPDYYEPRLIQPLNFRRDMFRAQTTGGATQVSYGEIRLINSDGGLDYLKGYAIAGQRFRMLIGRAGDGLVDDGEEYDGFVPLVSGRIGRVLFGVNAGGGGSDAETNAVVFQIRDRLQDFAQPLQVNKFAGSNVLPDGVEGTEDIKDKLKPLPFGKPQNVTLTCVNTSLLIYQVSDGVVRVVDAYDNGAAISRDFDYVDMADMLANAPPAGFYRLLVTLDGSYIRLGSTPVGTVTADITEILPFFPGHIVNSAAQVALRIASRTPEEGEGGITDDDVNWDDVDDLDAANPAEVGIDATNMTQLAAIDTVFGSVGAWHGFDRLGFWRMRRLELPASPYSITFRQAYLFGGELALGEFDILAYRFMPSNDPEKGEASWRLNLDWGVNYTVQQPDAIAGSVTDMDRRAFLSSATRTVTRESSQTRSFAQFAKEKKVSTVLIAQSDADAEAFRLLTIYGAVPGQDFLEIDAALTSDLIDLVDIGHVVNVVLPRLGYQSGLLMRVIGMGYNAAAGVVTLACWGGVSVAAAGGVYLTDEGTPYLTDEGAEILTDEAA